MIIIEHCVVLTCSVLKKALPLDAVGIDFQAEGCECGVQFNIKCASKKSDSAATLKKWKVTLINQLNLTKEWHVF